MTDQQQEDDLRYVPQRPVESVYVQRKLGPTPFSSGLTAEPSDSAAGSGISGSGAVVSALATDQTHEKMSYRMNYPMCVVRGGPIFPQDTVRRVPPARSVVDSNSLDPRSEPMQLRPEVLSGPKPNPYWQKAPPADQAAEARAMKTLGLPNSKHPLPRDTLHPLLTSMQAEANRIARELHPESGILSNAKRDGAPCTAHLHAATQVGAYKPQDKNASSPSGSSSSPGGGAMINGQQSSVSARGGGDPSSSSLDYSSSVHHQAYNTRPSTGRTDGSSTTGGGGGGDNDHDDGDNAVGGLRGHASAKRRRPHDQRSAQGRAYAAEGCLKDPAEYADNIQSFAQSMPTSLTAIAAKALGRALHDTDDNKDDANHNDKNKKIISTIPALSRGKAMTLPPSPAYRNMSDIARGVLGTRSRDTRHLLERVICETVPLSGPAPNELSQLMADSLASNGGSGSGSGSGSGAGLMHSMSMSSTGGGLPSQQSVLRADEVEVGDLLRVPLDLAPIFCAGGALHAWDVAASSLRGAALSKTSHDRKESAAGEVVKKLRTISTQTASLFSSATSRPKLVQFLTDVGIRSGDSLYQILAPSQSEFTRQPDRAQNLRQFGCTNETPGNTYGFDNGRFSVLLEHRGFDVEEASLNGATFLSPATVRLFGQYSPFLRLLDVSGCTHLSGSDVATALTRSRQSLRLLNISWIDTIGGAEMDEILPNLNNLVALCMSGLNKLSPKDDYAFQPLCRMKSLRILDVSHCSNLGDGVLVSAAQGCPCLEFIDMRGCSALTDAAAAAVASYCTQLRCWRMSYCARLTSASLVLISRCARKLEVLSIDGMSDGALTEPVFAAAIERARHLQCLSLAGSSNVHLTDDSLDNIVRRCPDLQVLDISGGRNFTMNGLTDLIHDLKQLRRLVVSASGLSKDQTSMLRMVKETVEIVDFENHQMKTAPVRIFGVKQPPPPPPPSKKPGQRR